jgi:hypothetical protein
VFYVSRSEEYIGNGLFCDRDIEKGEKIKIRYDLIIKMNDADFPSKMYLPLDDNQAFYRLFKAYHNNQNNNCRMIIRRGSHYLIALRNIPQGTELTRKYGSEFWKASSITALQFLNAKNLDKCIANIEMAEAQWHVPMEE